MIECNKAREPRVYLYWSSFMVGVIKLLQWQLSYEDNSSYSNLHHGTSLSVCFCLILIKCQAQPSRFGECTNEERCYLAGWPWPPKLRTYTWRCNENNIARWKHEASFESLRAFISEKVVRHKYEDIMNIDYIYVRFMMPVCHYVLPHTCHYCYPLLVPRGSAIQVRVCYRSAL